MKGIDRFGRIGKLTLAGMLIAGGPAGVLAASPGAEPTEAERTPPFLTSAAHVHVIGAMQDGPDGLVLVITLRVDRGFHINANPASQPYLIPTTLSFADFRPLRVAYPPAVRFKPKFADASIDVYEGTVAITAYFPKGLLALMPSPRAKVTVQACTDRICLPPADLTTTDR